MEENKINETTEATEQAPEVEAAPVEETPVVEESPVVEAAAKVDAAIDGAVDKVLGADDDGKKLSIAALVLGIVGIAGGAVLSMIPFAGLITFVCAILGIVLGVKGRKKSITANGKASGLATAGLVLGIIGTVLGGLFTLCSVCSAAVCAGIAAAA